MFFWNLKKKRKIRILEHCLSRFFLRFLTFIILISTFFLHLWCNVEWRQDCRSKTTRQDLEVVGISVDVSVHDSDIGRFESPITVLMHCHMKLNVIGHPYSTERFTCHSHTCSRWGWLKMQDVKMTDQKWRQGVKWREKNVQFQQRYNTMNCANFRRQSRTSNLCRLGLITVQCAALNTGSSQRITLIFDVFRIGVVTGYRGGMLNLYSVYSASNVRRFCAL